MANALTHKQLEVLRRVRDGIEMTAKPYIQGMLNELGLLRTFGLVEFRSAFDVAITADGRAYLLGATPLPDAEQDDAKPSPAYAASSSSPRSESDPARSS